jgi:hypothetical protein
MELGKNIMNQEQGECKTPIIQRLTELQFVLDHMVPKLNKEWKDVLTADAQLNDAVRQLVLTTILHISKLVTVI